MTSPADIGTCYSALATRPFAVVALLIELNLQGVLESGPNCPLSPLDNAFLPVFDMHKGTNRTKKRGFGINSIHLNVGIGTTSPGGLLDVNGTIFQRGASLHADYVFEPSYKLESIEDHSRYMWANKHLQAVPVAAKDEKGQDMVNWGERNRGVLEELEKAHVYIEQLNERIKALEARLAEKES